MVFFFRVFVQGSMISCNIFMILMISSNINAVSFSNVLVRHADIWFDLNKYWTIFINSGFGIVSGMRPLFVSFCKIKRWQKKETLIFFFFVALSAIVVHILSHWLGLPFRTLSISSQLSWLIYSIEIVQSQSDVDNSVSKRNKAKRINYLSEYFHRLRTLLCSSHL